ncbi:hypothetical protein [Chromobacterium sp. IIBBL 290-4]|uniref:hypothetical protein n=1 Tax=Chromobacterium sp. IIBBL 290-4 TaxID=2953890 RepID=UPI0020B7CA8F|nr:hypothetical protein [Chromobacterium sp. IIBBL 290-4]UTH73369.1 hypothetical protein NKT35_17780 [Chromobacterium sp. IIBBL 290-4]
MLPLLASPRGDLVWLLDENRDGLIDKAWRGGRMAGVAAASGRNGMALWSEQADE